MSYTTKGVKIKRETSLVCDLMAKDLLYPLSIIDRAGKVHGPEKVLEN